MASKRWGSGARVDSVDTGRKKLLKAAITCFVSKGIRATTIEDVANAANVTRRTVYRYYKGKPELIAAVVELERRRLFDELAAACEPHTNDFPRVLEECLVRAAEILSPTEGGQELVSSNAEEALAHTANTESNREWQRLFQAPYERYAAMHPEVGKLQDIINIVGRLALSFRHVPGEAETIRRALRALLTLPPSARH